MNEDMHPSPSSPSASESRVVENRVTIERIKNEDDSVIVRGWKSQRRVDAERAFADLSVARDAFKARASSLAVKSRRGALDALCDEMLGRRAQFVYAETDSAFDAAAAAAGEKLNVVLYDERTDRRDVSTETDAALD